MLWRSDTAFNLNFRLLSSLYCLSDLRCARALSPIDKIATSLHDEADREVIVILLQNLIKLTGRAAIALGVSLVLAACSSLPFMGNDDVEENAGFTDKPADQLYNEGLAYLAARDFKSANISFAELDQFYPYSEFSRKGLILQAYTHFSRGKYISSITAAQRFLQLYPSDKDAAYAQYLVGQSYFRQIPIVDRDQSTTQQAYDAFTALITKWPDSEYVEDAKAKRRVTEDQLAGKEMEVGRYYLERKQYLGAINRFRTVVEDFQTTSHIEEALARLTESYYALGVVNEAQTAAAILGTNFPDSDWYRDAYDLLNKGGYQPEVSQGSWLERAFGSTQLL